MGESIASADYLASTDVVDWFHPDVHTLAWLLACGEDDPLVVARRCFEWVRDEIEHCVDSQRTEVTCRASDVLYQRTGYCYAKSHLLAALLRANRIPTGVCYQRLSLDGAGEPFCLHGLNGMWLPGYSWYRVDARGNRAARRQSPAIDAQFTPPVERLAFEISQPGEADLPDVLAEPLPVVVEALSRYDRADVLFAHLPDVSELVHGHIECLSRTDPRAPA